MNRTYRRKGRSATGSNTYVLAEGGSASQFGKVVGVKRGELWVALGIQPIQCVFDGGVHQAELLQQRAPAKLHHQPWVHLGFVSVMPQVGQLLTRRWTLERVDWLQ